MLLWVEGGGLPKGPEGQNPGWEPCLLTHGVSLGTASVFCVSLDPKTNTLAVTGGEDDKAFVWRLSDGELLFECAGERAWLRSCPLEVLGRWPAAVVPPIAIYGLPFCQLYTWPEGPKE